MAVPSQIPIGTGNLPTSLLKDDIFLAIHDAFLLGGSILELKSRIQIAACNPEQIQHTISSKGMSQSNAIDTLIKGIVLADLQMSSVTLSPKLTTDEPQAGLPLKALPSELRDQEWLTNILRALFNHIVTLHLGRFPKSDTHNTIYSIQSIKPSIQYLDGEYAQIGIPAIKDDGNGKTFKDQFELYDVARRAINCLTLLLTTAEATLIRQTISDNQKHLVEDIAKATTDTPPDSANGGVAAPSQDDQKKQHAIKILTDLLVQLLDAWDSFLRESYYADSASQQTELELTAYEAGRSLAALSWNASVILAPLENIFSSSAENQSEEAKQALESKARKTWSNVFKDRDVNYVQYQLMALSTALDEAYYRVNPNIKRADPDEPTTSPNPDLPSQAIQAIVQSLNYWQRAITRTCICKQKDGIQPSPSKPLLSTEVPPSKLLDWDMSMELRKELVQQSYIWQSLVLCQQSLQSFSTDKVTQKILNEFMSDFEDAVKADFRRATQRWWLFAVVIAVIILALLGIPAISALVNLAKNGSNLNLSTLLQNPLAFIAALAALMAPLISGLGNRFARFWNTLAGRFGTVGTDIAQGLTRGYEQVLNEFNYLNYHVGITYPLVEFFIWEEISFNGNPVKDGYDFLVHVFWTSQDREEELKRVTRAAFGPIGAYIEAQLHPPTGSNSTQRSTQTASNKQ